MRPEDLARWRAADRRRDEAELARDAAVKKKALEEKEAKKLPPSPGETRPSTDERPQGSALDPGF